MMTKNEEALVAAIEALTYSEMMGFAESLDDTLNDAILEDAEGALSKDKIAQALRSIAESWREADAEERASA